MTLKSHLYIYIVFALAGPENDQKVPFVLFDRTGADIDPDHILFVREKYVIL